MGYTHYFDQQRDCPPEQWTEICDGFRQMLAHGLLGKPLPVQLAPDDTRPPQITDEEIVFNGQGSGGCETFCLNRRMGRDGFQFCKTRQRDYDYVVVAVLCLANYYAPGIWLMSSDGSVLDMTDGLCLARSIEPEADYFFHS